MSEVKDPAIKLFGKTIQLLHLDDREHIKKTLEKQHATTQTEDTCPDQSTSSGINNNDDPKTPTTEKETSSRNTTKKNNPEEDSKSNIDEKPPKPDKILPCPRCNSMDTKFCYYNNYNVNQPRHFCKNCQRYWTAGGTMRNTPVGSGRRKNKSSSAASYHRHLIIHDTSLKTYGGVLNFCSDVPLCESMNKALKFSDKTHKPEHDHSTNSASNSAEKGENSRKYPLQIPCYPAPQWPYPLNSSQYRPVSFYPPPQYCGYNVQVQPITPWSMQWMPPPHDQISPNSPLGKHSRDGS